VRITPTKSENQSTLRIVDFRLKERTGSYILYATSQNGSHTHASSSIPYFTPVIRGRVAITFQ
jgi:hypothetical protein